MKADRMTRARQLAFDMETPPSYAAEDFVVGAGNSAARDLAGQLAWPTAIGIVVGEHACGKTHLARIFADRFDDPRWFAGKAPHRLAGTSALIIDGLEGWIGDGGDAVFHALEAARAAQAPVLVTARKAPEQLAVTRPDTLSRLRAGQRAQIAAPDDALLAAIAVKLFTDRQLLVEPAIARYLLHRVERSYSHLADLIAEIDRRALEAGRSITKPLAGEVLDAFEAGRHDADKTVADDHD